MRASRLGGLWLLLALLFAGLGQGFMSSNDGSHAALARAFAAGRLHIDPDRDLTLQVDLARRGEHFYSDRPPATAAAATASLAMGAALDPAMADATRRRQAMMVRPASRPYIDTYVARTSGGPALYELQATALALRLHAGMMGALGVVVAWLWAGARGVSEGSRAVSVLALGAASLWGPYSTVLFSHVSAGVGLAILLWLGTSAGRDRGARVAVAGAAGAFAVACDYSLIAVVVPISLVCISRRRWLAMAGGAVGVAAALAIYHTAAFGSPFAIGYDFSTNFDFARTRRGTFSGNPLEGAWILLGPGRGGGLFVLSPVAAVGIYGLWKEQRRLLLALIPWMVLLCFHATPWGGAFEDHRYLIPALPLLALGVGEVWEGAGVRARGVIAALLAVSTALVWWHFSSWG